MKYENQDYSQREIFIYDVLIVFRHGINIILA